MVGVATPPKSAVGGSGGLELRKWLTIPHCGISSHLLVEVLVQHLVTWWFSAGEVSDPHVRLPSSRHSPLPHPLLMKKQGLKTDRRIGDISRLKDQLGFVLGWNQRHSKNKANVTPTLMLGQQEQADLSLLLTLTLVKICSSSVELNGGRPTERRSPWKPSVKATKIQQQLTVVVMITNMLIDKNTHGNV